MAVGVTVAVGVAVSVAVAVGVGVGVAPDCAQYLPPVLKKTWASELYPPHTIISLPVHTAVCLSRAAGAPVVVTAVQGLPRGSVARAGL